MNSFTGNLQSRLELALQEIALSSANEVEKALRSLTAAENALWELKSFMSSYHFNSMEEEIRFFKEIKTGFSKEQIFYTKLLFIENHRPTDNRASLKKYLRNLLKGIELYYHENQAFYSYYKMSRQDMDEQFFVRQAQPILSILPAARPDLDAHFGNPYTLKLAKIQAFERLAGYLADLLDHVATNRVQNKSDLFWSGTDSQFVELLMGLHSRGAINHGALNFSQLAEKLGNRLGFSSRNLHQIVKNIRSRKKDRTVFLKQLIESTERQMDERDF